MEEKIIEYFKNKNIEIIYLFGSAARGELRDESDIDIAVIGNFDFNTKLDYILELQDLLEKEIDFVNLEKVDTVFQAEIVSTGKCIYYKNENYKQELEMKILSKYLKLEEDREIILKSIYERGSVF